MKPIRFSKKLKFNKETIADLSIKEMNTANGGAAENCTATISCPNTQTVCQTDCPSGTMVGQLCCRLC
jgi:natural product precursor